MTIEQALKEKNKLYYLLQFKKFTDFINLITDFLYLFKVKLF